MAPQRQPHARRVEAEQIAAMQPVVKPRETLLKQKRCLAAPLRGSRRYVRRLRSLAPRHKHTGVNAAGAQRLHEAPADDGGATAHIAVVYDYNFHRLNPGRGMCSTRTTAATYPNNSTARSE